MKRWRILRIGETEVFLHPAVILYLAYSGLTGHLPFTLAAFGSIILHEAAHGITSAVLGQSPSSLEITPLGAVMRVEDERRLSCFKRALTILAGPAMTLLLCWLATACASKGSIPTQLARMVFLSNLSILLLNLLPVLPLDGGRLLMLVLEGILPQKTAAALMKWISAVAGTGLIILNVVFSWRYGGWNLSLAFAGCCILYSAAMFSVTHAMSEMRFFLDRKIMLERSGCKKTCWITALQTMPVRRLVRALPPGKMVVFLCAEAGTARVIGMIHESQLIQAYLDEPGILLVQAVKIQNMRFDFDKSDTI